VTAAAFEPTQGEIAFIGGAVTGEVRFDQRCRDRTNLAIRYGGGD
jgi:hypothetical protein